ncbi:MAG: DNA methyltransferase [Polyangiales bacterium]
MKKKLPAEARTALKHVGGSTEKKGDPELSDLLARSFDVGEDDEAAIRAHVHGFHSYPARLHPVVAARLLEGLAPSGGRVLDPFCGSGTVLVEGRLLGLATIGTDVNPLALRIARFKTRGVPAQERNALVEYARKIEKHVTRRRKEGARVTKRYDQEDVDLFEPHVLLELDSLRDGLDTVHSKGLREDLELIFSAILTKASKQRGDTGSYLQQRRLAPGFVAKLFVSKAEEAADALAQYERMLPENAPPADIHADDARTLGTLRAGSIDLVLSSPPYAATYDYLDHHDVRLRWLRLRSDRFEGLELGARREYANLTGGRARAKWEDELGRTLKGMARALAPSGTVVLVLADSAVRDFALRADSIVDRLAPDAGLALVASASQPRPHFHSATRAAFRDAPRKEHLLALRKT